jgi:hypothetical protein
MNVLQIRTAITALSLAAFTTAPASAQTALTPDKPALQASSISPAVTPPATALVSSASTTASNNSSIVGLAQLLTDLQTQLEQVLPMLNSFNNSFDFISVGSLTPTGATGGTGANFSSSMGVNFSSSAGANLSTSMAVPTLSSAPSTPVNAFGLPPGLGVAPITSESLRALLVLQSDIERMLPTLAALNGGTNVFIGIGLTPGFGAGAVTNVFMVPTAIR